MGQSYVATLSIKVKEGGEPAVCEALRKYMKDCETNVVGVPIAWPNGSTDTLDDCVMKFLPRYGIEIAEPEYIGDGRTDHRYSCDFHGSYSWSEILHGIVPAIKDVVLAGTSIDFEDDAGDWELTVEGDGGIESNYWPHDEDDEDSDNDGTN